MYIIIYMYVYIYNQHIWLIGKLELLAVKAGSGLRGSRLACVCVSVESNS